jgi:hypothetical protein
VPLFLPSYSAIERVQSPAEGRRSSPLSNRKRRSHTRRALSLTSCSSLAKFNSNDVWRNPLASFPTLCEPDTPPRPIA